MGGNPPFILVVQIPASQRVAHEIIHKVPMVRRDRGFVDFWSDRVAALRAILTDRLLEGRRAVLFDGDAVEGSNRLHDNGRWLCDSLDR